MRYYQFLGKRDPLSQNARHEKEKGCDQKMENKWLKNHRESRTAAAILLRHARIWSRDWDVATSDT